jgi:hypothetical protein
MDQKEGNLNMDLQRVNNVSAWKKLLSKKYTLMVPRDAGVRK